MVTINLSGSGGDVDEVFDRDPAVAIGDAIYLSGSNLVNRANASAEATTPAIGFCTALVGPTQCRIRIEKSLGIFSGLTPGDPVFLGLTPGSITQDVSGYVAGQVVQELGLAVNPTTILVRVDTDPTVLS
jgi:hypothetical protein